MLNPAKPFFMTGPSQVITAFSRPGGITGGGMTGRTVMAVQCPRPNHAAPMPKTSNEITKPTDKMIFRNGLLVLSSASTSFAAQAPRHTFVRDATTFCDVPACAAVSCHKKKTFVLQIREGVPR